MAITDFDAKLADISRVFHDTAGTLNQEADNDPALAALVDEFPCDGTSWKVADLLNIPEMKESVGPRTYESLRAIGDTVEVKSHSKDLAIPLLEINGDRSGIIARKLADFVKGGSDKLKLATDKLVAGFTDLGYDGVALFSAAHTNGPDNGTQSNKIGTNDALSFSAYKTARQQMRELRDESGRPLRITPRVLVVGPKNEQLALEIVAPDRNQNVDDNGALDATSGVDGLANRSSGLAGTATVVVNPRLIGDYDDYWFLVDDTKPTKVIGMGVQPEANMTPSDNISTGQYRQSHEAQFSVDFYAGVGYTFWQLVAGSTGAGS